MSYIYAGPLEDVGTWLLFFKELSIRYVRSERERVQHRYMPYSLRPFEKS